MTPPPCRCGETATGLVVEGHLHPYCAWQASEERREALRGAIGTARQMMDDALSATPGMAHHLRVSADRHLDRALAADREGRP